MKCKQQPVITIAPEFLSRIPPLAATELIQLEANVVAEGCRDPLVVWAGKGILLDGHHRYDICTRHGIPFRVVERAFASREDAADWIDTNQLGRRNLHPAAMSLLRGRRYNRLKATHGGSRTKHSPATGRFVPLKSSEKLARLYGVDEKTIRRDSIFAAAVEALRKRFPSIERRVMTGDIRSRETVIRAAHDSAHAGVLLKARAYVVNNTAIDEWYTPPEFIEAARTVMGGIDLDPASSDAANAKVNATTHYTTDTDGLAHEWAGRVWMNPPYSRRLITQFIEKLIAYYQAGSVSQACVLVNNATQTRWFQRLAKVSSAICFPKGLIAFWRADSPQTGQPLQGQAILYLGRNYDAFRRRFSRLGLVVQPKRSPGRKPKNLCKKHQN